MCASTAAKCGNLEAMWASSVSWCPYSTKHMKSLPRMEQGEGKHLRDAAI